MSRTTARAAVMQMIYEHLEGGEGGEETLRLVYDELRETGVTGVDKVNADEPVPEDREYIDRVLRGVLSHLDEIDERINGAAVGWTTERMSMIDLTVMRLAVWEICYEDDIPDSVAISQALDLIDQYSDPSDKSFVNGVLGTICRKFEAKQ